MADDLTTEEFISIPVGITPAEYSRLAEQIGRVSLDIAIGDQVLHLPRQWCRWLHV